MMKQCPNCGSVYEDGKKFCSDCGCALPEPDTEEPELFEPGKPPEEEPKADLVDEQPIPEVQPTVESDLSEPEPEKPAEAEESPAEEKAAAEEKPKKGKKKKKEKTPRVRPEVGAGRRILAGLLCFLLFFFLLVPGLGIAVRRAATEEGLGAVLAEIDLGNLRIDPYFDDVTDELSLGQMLSEDLAGIGIQVSEKSVGKILRTSGIKAFLARQMSGLFSDIFRGRARYEYDPDSLKDELLSSKTARAMEKEGLTLSVAQAGKITAMVNAYGVGDLLSKDEFKAEFPEVYRAMHLGLGYFALGTLLVIALLLIILIFRVNRGRLGLSFGDIGGTLLAVGLILCLAALFARLLPGVWQKLCLGDELLALASAGVLYYNLRVSLIVLGVGLVLAVLGRLLRGPRKPERQETAPAPEED